MRRPVLGLLALACTFCVPTGSNAQQTIVERQQAMFRRNVGRPEEQRAQFPPHRIVGNHYYVGSQSLASFLIATPEGHILINTNWEDGESYDIVIIGSMGSNPGFQFVDNPTNPTIAERYRQGFAVLRSLTPDIPLASHPAMYNMVEKYERLGRGPNPFVDPEGYIAEIDAVETLFLDVFREQRASAAAAP